MHTRVKDIFVVVYKEDIESLMADPKFLDNAILINSNMLYDEYGNTSYLVRLKWLKEKGWDITEVTWNGFYHSSSRP